MPSRRRGGGDEMPKSWAESSQQMLRAGLWVLVAPPAARPAEIRKAGHKGPALDRVAGGGSHHPAGRIELALTWRSMTLVVAPQEHPLPVGLRSKREAGDRRRRTWKHATPWTEALHVPLHLQRSCWTVALGLPLHAHAGRWFATPRRSARRVPSRQLGWGRTSGSGWDREQLAGTCIRELVTAVPSMSAWLSAILRYRSCAFSRLWGAEAWRACPGPVTRTDGLEFSLSSLGAGRLQLTLPALDARLC